MNKRVVYDGALKNAKAGVNGQSGTAFVTKANLESSFYSAVLPEEILEKIFLNLEDSRDLEAVSNATPQFRRIVKPSMPVWGFDQILPLVFSRLDKEDILQCRLVCKKWNSTVNRCVQNQPQHQGLTPYPYHPTQAHAFDDRSFSRNHPAYRPEWHSTLFSKKLFGVILSSVDEIEKISEKMQTTICNPFVTRSVCFSNGYDDDQETYWSCALSFLEKYGKHIWHADVRPNGPRALFNYQVLRHALCCMPNIRTLELTGYLFEDGNSPGAGNSLRRYIQGHPLPSLPHLHTIVHVDNEIGQLVVDELRQKYSGQFGTLTTTTQREDPPLWNTLTRLTALKLFMHNDGYESWEHFVRSSSAPHLAKLSLKVHATDTVSISNLLKPLQNAFPSLVYLHIGVSRYSEILGFSDTRTHKCSGAPSFLLENVKTLEVNDHPSLQFNHILSFFPALEYVVVRHEYRVPIHCDVEDEREMEIRLLMRNRSMYKSDIWTRIKTLKEFTLVTSWDPDYIYGDDDMLKRQFTRHGYDWYIGDKL